MSESERRAHRYKDPSEMSDEELVDAVEDLDHEFSEHADDIRQLLLGESPEDGDSS